MVDKPFVHFARHYDRFMLRYVDYADWIDYVEKIFRKFRVQPKRVLDLACGSGIPTMLMAQRGYELVGVDRSPEMLAVLDDKRRGNPVETVQADIRDFTLAEPVDAAICLYDSINYLTEDIGIRSCFACVRRALLPGGLFVFDMNTLYGLSEFWGNRTTPRTVGNISSLWQNSFDRKLRVSTLHLTFWEETDPDEPPQRFDEVHQERAYTKREVRDALEATGFERTWFYSHGGFMPVGPLSSRMMVVAR